MRPLNKWIERAHGPNLSVNHYQPQDCEGSAPLTRLVVSEFPTVEAAQQFYDSAEYQAILKRGAVNEPPALAHSGLKTSPSPIPQMSIKGPALPKASTVSHARHRAKCADIANRLRDFTLVKLELNQRSLD